MDLYNLINETALPEGGVFPEMGNTPSFIRIGGLPFSRLYLVSRDRARIQEYANVFNEATNESFNLGIQRLSKKGKWRFYFGRYFLGNLSFILGESADLDTDEERIATYVDWTLKLSSK